jgi:multiple inositol-polyphosphate phosphatase/2,3-bisphosphoglycerate 3-phosphatase
VAMSMLPKRRDAVLRFFQVCPAYLQHEDTVERWLVSCLQADARVRARHGVAWCWCVA